LGYGVSITVKERTFGACKDVWNSEAISLNTNFFSFEAKKLLPSRHFNGRQDSQQYRHNIFHAFALHKKR